MINRANYKLVKEFIADIENEGIATNSLERYRFNINHLLLWADKTHFSNAESISLSFVKYVAKLPGRRGEEHLVASSQKKIINIAKRFFLWAKLYHPGDFKRLSPGWIEKLKPGNMPDMSEEMEFVTYEEVIHLATYPIDRSNLDLWRMQATVAFMYISGIRAEALTTLPIKAVNLEAGEIRQWPALGVKTKNGKKATTFLLPVPKLMEVVREWDAFVRQNYPDHFPWFAPIKADWGKYEIDVYMDKSGKLVLGKNRSINLSKRLRVYYKEVGLPYHSPHKFRHGHAVWGLMHARDMADYKAISINMMHEDVETTDSIYVGVLPSDVKKRISELADRPTFRPDFDLLSYVKGLAKNQLPHALADLGTAVALASKRLADE